MENLTSMLTRKDLERMLRKPMLSRGDLERLLLQESPVRIEQRKNACGRTRQAKTL